MSAMLDAHSRERDKIVVAAAAAAATEISLELLVLEAPAVAGRPPENIYYFFAALDCRKQVPVNCLSPWKLRKFKKEAAEAAAILVFRGLENTARVPAHTATY